MIGAEVSSIGYIQNNNVTAMQLAVQKYDVISVSKVVSNPFYSYA